VRAPSKEAHKENDYRLSHAAILFLLQRGDQRVILIRYTHLWAEDWVKVGLGISVGKVDAKEEYDATTSPS